MMLLNGRIVKEEGLTLLKNKISSLKRKPSLAVIQVGNDEASNIYIRNKEKTAVNLECGFKHIKYDEDVKEEKILEVIDELNNDTSIDGIIVQMPIPKHLNASNIQNRIKSSKDVDGLTDINAGLLFHNKECLSPATAIGIINLLKHYNIELSNKHVVIVGRSNLVGKPLMSLMLNNDATVTICHSKTNNLSEITKTADILIAAVGKKDLITTEMVKDGAVIVDVGINKVNDKLYGDIDFDNVKEKVSYITPVPGGVGQMTILELFNNLYKAYELNKIDSNN